MQNTTPVPPPGAIGKQAVAFRISADTTTFVGCKFLGAQDTLYDHLGRHYYEDCYNEGSVDFIFGNGLSFFEGWHSLRGCYIMRSRLTFSMVDIVLKDTPTAPKNLLDVALRIPV
ncbi:putative pectinesterase 53 [Capsicum chinense]|nr:putative pectinesterase 53 [Capsicum chinense]